MKKIKTEINSGDGILYRYKKTIDMDIDMDIKDMLDNIVFFIEDGCISKIEASGKFYNSYIGYNTRIIFSTEKLYLFIKRIIAMNEYKSEII